MITQHNTTHDTKARQAKTKTRQHQQYKVNTRPGKIRDKDKHNLFLRETILVGVWDEG